MTLTMRPYRADDDFWRIRAFLRETYLLNERRERNWQAYRFDYWYWHINANITHCQLDETIFLWETTAGKLAAMVNPDGNGEAFLQIHPGVRSPELEEEMVAVAENHLARTDAESKRSLYVWANSDDALRQTILRQRGYAKGTFPEHQRYRSLDTPLPDAPLAPGYTMRALGEGAELLERCYASGLAFHPDSIQYAIDNRADVTWYRNIQNAPMYRRDLDLVVLAADGAVAAFATLWFDEVTRTGALEPVGTVPAHQRRGLGKALLSQGLRRLKRIGATRAVVGSYDAPAHALYESVGFRDYDLLERWKKEWA